MFVTVFSGILAVHNGFQAREAARVHAVSWSCHIFVWFSQPTFHVMSSYPSQYAFAPVITTTALKKDGVLNMTTLQDSSWGHFKKLYFDALYYETPTGKFRATVLLRTTITRPCRKVIIELVCHCERAMAR